MSPGDWQDSSLGQVMERVTSTPHDLCKILKKKKKIVYQKPSIFRVLTFRIVTNDVMMGHVNLWCHKKIINVYFDTKFNDMKKLIFVPLILETFVFF